MPDDQPAPTAQQLLAALLTEEQAQTALLRKQDERVADIQASVEVLYDIARHNEHAWKRANREINIAFWVIIGIPLLLIGLTLLFGLAALGG